MAELLPHELRRRTKVGEGRQQQDAEDGRRGRGVDARAPLYGRNVRRTTKFKAHDEENRCQIGDIVVIAESRPISKEKRWVVREIVKETIGRPGSPGRGAA